MSKKQIWLVYEKEHEGNPKDVVFVTTNFQKVRSFLENKIRKGYCFYCTDEWSVTKQIQTFKYDMRHNHRALINDYLSSYYFTYWYDGEEM